MYTAKEAFIIFDSRNLLVLLVGWPERNGQRRAMMRWGRTLRKLLIRILGREARLLMNGSYKLWSIMGERVPTDTPIAARTHLSPDHAPIFPQLTPH